MKLNISDTFQSSFPIWFTIRSLSILLFVSSIYSQPTRVCFRDDVDITQTKPIQTPDDSFLSLIQHSCMFVDKSLLLLDVISNREIKWIAAPDGWGKTIYSKMIEFFFNIETDSNGQPTPYNATKAYKFFVHGIVSDDSNTVIYKLKTPPLISRETNFIEKYLGQHPVLYLKFPDNEGMFLQLDQSLNKYFKSITLLFNKFNFIKKIWHAKIHNKNISSEERRDIFQIEKLFDNFYNTSMNEGLLRICDGYSELSGHIADCLGKTPILLVDDIDSWITAEFCPEDESFELEQLIEHRKRKLKYHERQLEFIRIFISRTFKPGSYHTAIVTSTFPPDELTSIRRLNKFQLYSVQETRQLHPFFGFSLHDCIDMMNLRGINESLQQTELSIYKGYFSLTNSTPLFRPQTIVKFLNRRTIQSHWIKSKIAIYVYKSMRQFKGFAKAVKHLNEGHTREIAYGNISTTPLNIHFQLHELNIRKTPFQAKDVDMILGLLTSLGYYTIVPEKTYQNIKSRDMVSIKVPNDALKNEINSYIFQP